MRVHVCILAPALTLLCGLPAVGQDKKPARTLITNEAREAIDAGLAYLVKQQAKDGSWGDGQWQGNLGITSLAGLAFLARGDYPNQPRQRDAILKAVDFILANESKQQAGFFVSEKAAHGPMYGHGYAVLFLAEAHAMLPEKRKRELKQALERAVKLILESQNKDGGWRYRPEPKDADITVTACQVHALYAARAAGIEVPKAAMDNSQRYILSCQDAAGQGGFRYQSFGGPPGFARTAAAISALQRTGMDRGEMLEKGFKYLLSDAKPLPNAETQLHFHFRYYYAMQALRRHTRQEWEQEYSAIRDVLLAKPPEGHRQADGSWSLGMMGPDYCTAMSILILQSPESQIDRAKK